MQTVLVTNAVWCIDEDDINTYGDYETAADALDLPDGFSIDVEDDYDVEEVIRVSAEEKYGIDLETYDYEIIGDDDDDDYDEI